MKKASAQITLYHIIDIKASYRYYLLQNSTLAKPSKPTSYPPASTWTNTEPSYTSGSTKSLFFVDCTVFSNDTFKYSEVSLSTSYEAAKESYNKAVAADNRVANAETKIKENTTAIALKASKTELNALIEGNLIVNGFGLNKNNYNFSQWTFDGADKCDGYPSFSFTGTPRDMYIPQYMIPIDISKTYEFSMFFKGDSSKKLYIGWDEFDIDGNWISPTYSMGFSDSTTTLAKDLKNGDTVVYLTSASGWTSTTQVHQLGLIFWNYKDSTGYQYPEGVYSRNSWTNLYTFDNVNKTNNTITLKSAWNHGAFPAGTKVSQTNSAGHKYFKYQNSAYPTDWTEVTHTISGKQSLYTYQSNKINQAAKYIRFLMLHNYGGDTTTSTSKIAKVVLRDATVDKNLTDNYYNKTQTDAKIKVESDKISSAVSRISDNETAISTLEQTADGLTVRLNTTDNNLSAVQSTANSVKNDLANNYTKKSLPDTRNDNQPPSWYFTNYPKQIITEFKSCSKIGLSGVGTYCTLQTIVPWTDSSGGYPKQTAKVESTGKEFWRVGTSASAWSSWIDPYALANTARTEAANAAKTATNFLGFSSAGLVVGDMTANTLGKNVLIDSDSVDIRTGETVLASFGANKVILGQNSQNSEIDLCGGAGVIKALTSGASTSYPHYDSIRIESQEIELECKTYDARTTYKDSSGYTYESSHRGLSGASGFGGVSSKTTAPADSSGTIYINNAGMSASTDTALNQTRSWLYASQDKTVGNTTSNVKSNSFNVYADYCSTTKPIKIGSGRTAFTGENKTLWSGAWYMQDGQTSTLSEAVTSQANGIVLVFSLYSDNAAANQEFFTYFIHKSFCDTHNGKGLVVPLHSPWGNSVKYLYISNTTISGHSNNNLTDKTVGGITYNNRRFVMRYVIGV